MNSRNFFLVACLQLVTAFFVSVKILQEIFLTNSHFLSGISLSPLFLTLLASAVLGLANFRPWYSDQRFYLLMAATLALFSFLGSLLFAGTLFAWVFALTAFAFLFLFGCESIVSYWSKKMAVVVLAFNAIITLLLQIDWHVFMVTRAHLNLKILLVVMQDQALLAKAAKYSGSESQLIFWELLLLALVPLALGLLLCRFIKKTDESRFRPQVILVPLLLALAHYSAFDLVCQHTSLPQYMSLRISFGSIPLPLHPQLKANRRLEQALNQSHLVSPEKCYQPAEVSWQPGGYEKIVLIGVESLRYDAFAALMPKTRELAATGKLFTRHYANANITLSSFYSLLNFNFPINLVFTPEKLQKSVFEKIAIENGFSTVLVKPEIIGSSTLDLWGQQKAIVKSQEPWMTTSDALAQTLEQMKKPGRAIIQTYIFNTHFNYYFPPEFEKFTPVCAKDANIFLMQPTPENNLMIRNRYKNSVLFLDHCLNEFFLSAKEQSLNEKTLFVIFGDHGQSLRETGCLGHGTGADILQYHVPLLVIGKNETAETIDVPTSHFNALAHALVNAGFSIKAPFAGLDRKFPQLALEESVAGRILVIQQDYFNIFDLSPANELRWIALVSHNFTLDAELIGDWYQNPDKLAAAIEGDLAFLQKTIGKN